MIFQQNLKKFLKEAKINTYAKGGEGKERILHNHGKMFEYGKGQLYYRDIYFGSNFKDKYFRYVNRVDGSVRKFFGEEKIFYKNKLVYALNYQGGLIDE